MPPVKVGAVLKMNSLLEVPSVLPPGLVKVTVACEAAVRVSEPTVKTALPPAPGLELMRDAPPASVSDAIVSVSAADAGPLKFKVASLSVRARLSTRRLGRLVVVLSKVSAAGDDTSAPCDVTVNDVEAREPLPVSSSVPPLTV